MQTNPSPENFISWQERNPFPQSPDSSNINLQQIETLHGGVFNISGDATIEISTPDTATKKAIRELEKRVGQADEKIELTRNEVKLLAQALSDLDGKTSGIKELPDGRTRLGGLITGQASVVIEEHNAAVAAWKATRRSMVEALQHSQNAINAYESTEAELRKIKGVKIVSGNLKKEVVGKIYWFASIPAFFLKINDLALEYLNKSIMHDPTTQNKDRVTHILIALGQRKQALQYVNEALEKEPDNKGWLQLRERALRLTEGQPSEPIL
jgi:tetratricopeptide (TPR) repeat protein